MTDILNVKMKDNSSFKVKPLRAPGCTFPVASILGVFFVVCKVLQIGLVAEWSWLWVLSPFWLPITIVVGIPILIVLGLALFAGGVYVIAWILDSLTNVYRRRFKNRSYSTPLALRLRA